jgi:hypothetical protein
MRTLCDLLAKHDVSAERCFIGVWEGYGWLPLSDTTWTSRLVLDQRSYVIGEGPIAVATETGWRDPQGVLVPEPPTLIWPADHSWFVAGDVDLDSTYVGGSQALISRILAEPDLEAFVVKPSDRISVDGDSINVR